MKAHEKGVTPGSRRPIGDEQPWSKQKHVTK